MVYPVQAYTQLIPPYTPYTPSYYSGYKEKLTLTLINSDLQQPVLNVYLRMRISSSSFSITTPDHVYTPEIQLQAGVPLRLSLDELAPYFRTQNMQISGGQSQFLKTLMLPDNFYRFWFEVYDVNTRRLLSNPYIGFAQAMITTGDPPVLNLPLKGSIITEQPITNIMFSWTPRHFTSVAAAYGTEYEITLVELFDKRIAPESAFLFGRPLYTERTASTTFIHNAFQPLLVPGMRYAWRVRAVARDGLEEANVFKNDGFSEVFYFDYAADCETVTQSVVMIEKTTAKITWVMTKASEYTVRYRKKGAVQWREAIANGNECPLYGLEYGKTYEYCIGTRCVSNDAFEYNNAKSFTMPELPERNPDCGLLPEADLSNREPLLELQPGLPVFAGDFPVFISSVSGSNGRFSGTGYVGIPLTGLPKVAVVFNDIMVNSDYRLIGGYFEVKYDPKGKSMMVDIDETLTGGGGVGDIRSGEERAKYTVNYGINPDADIEIKPSSWDDLPDDIKNSSGYTPATGENPTVYVVTVEDSEGNKHDIVVESLPATVSDKNGNTYVVSQDGNITEAISDSDLTMNPEEKDKPRSDIATVAFEVTPNTRYAFDLYREIYAKVPEYYVKYKPSAGEMLASAKFIQAGESDEMFVRIKERSADFDPQKVRFLTGNGKEYKGDYNSVENGWTLTLIGGQAGDGQEVYVVYETSPGKTVTLDMIRTYSYSPKTVELKLIPVNDFRNDFTASNVSQALNEIYNRVGVRVEVTMADNFTYEPLKNRAFDVTGSGLFSTQTADMKALNAAYSEAHPDNNSISLFIIENVTGADGVAGDMPRGKQFGYLFPGSNARTIAHEIGHGVFRLEHPFDRPLRGQFEKYELPHTLMDYGDGTEFSKLDWDAMHSPGLIIGLFEKDESGMNYIVRRISEDFVNADNKSVSFLTPAGKIISLPQGTLYNVEFEYGALYTIQGDKQNLHYTSDLTVGTLAVFSLGTNDKDKATYKYDRNGSYVNIVTKEPYIPNVDNSQVNGFVFPIPCGESYNLYKFPLGGLSQYANEKEDDLSFLTLTDKFIPFSSNFPPIKVNGKIVVQTLDKVVYSNCNYCMDINTVKMTQSHCEQPELIWIDKIAQLRAVFPEYFDSFTQPEKVYDPQRVIVTENERNTRPGNWETPETFRFELYTEGFGTEEYFVRNTDYVWGKYLEDNPQVKSKYQTDKAAFFKVFYAEFKDYISKGSNESGDFWSNFSVSTPVSDVHSHLKKEAMFDLQQVDKNKKLIAIKNFVDTKKENILNSLLISDYEEDVIKLLASFKKSEAKEVLMYIEQNIGYQNIYKNFYDRNKWWGVNGQDNFTAVLMLLSNMITSSGYTTIDEDREINYLDNINSLLSLEADMFQFKNLIWNFADENHLNLGNVYTFIPYNQLISIKIAGSFTVGNQFFTKGTIIQVPAMQAALMSHANTVQVGEKTAWLALDLGALAIGLGEANIFLSAGNYMRKAIVAADIAGSAAAAIAQSLNEDAITPELRSRIQIAGLVLSLPNIARAISKIEKVVDDLDEAIRIGKNTKGNALTYSEKAELERIRDGLRNRAGIATSNNERAKTFIESALGRSTKFAEDEDVLRTVAKYLNDEKKLNVIGGEQDLKNFIDKYKDAPCLACGNTGHTIYGGRTLDKMIENYVEVAYTFRNEPRLWAKLRAGAEHNNVAVREGTQHMLETFNKNPNKYSPNKIQDLDMNFEAILNDICENCLFDVKFVEGSTPRLVEFKSYSTSTWESIKSSDKFIKQFKRYLQANEIKRLDDLNYVFNTNKADITEVKNAFKDLFTAKEDDIFEVIWDNQNLRNSLFGNRNNNAAKSYFKELVKGSDNNKLYNFIISE